MKADFDAFPFGGAQGLPVLRLDCEGQPFDLARAHELVRERESATGVWGIWLDRVDDWTAADLRTFLLDQDQASRISVAIRDLCDKVWPASGCEFVLDGSAAISAAGTVRELASYLTANAAQHPAVQDLVIRLGAEQPPPSTAVLDMLAEWVGAEDLNYLYLPPNYEFRPLALRSICRCGSRWALR